MKEEDKNYSLSDDIKDTSLSILPDLSGLLDPEIVNNPGLIVGRVGVAILANKLNKFYREYKEKKLAKKIKAIESSETDYPPQTLYELLDFINKENPDEDRLKAIKAVFFHSLKEGGTGESEKLGYQFLQIIKKLTGDDVLILKACYEVAEGKVKDRSWTIVTNNVNQWAETVAKQIGHGIPDLVTVREKELVELRLIVLRENPQEYLNPYGTFNAGVHFRLTDAGFKLCEYICAEE